MTIADAIWKIFRVLFWLTMVWLVGQSEHRGFWFWVGLIACGYELFSVLKEKAK